jgi:hypothetical protein
MDCPWTQLAESKQTIVATPTFKATPRIDMQFGEAALPLKTHFGRWH